VRKPADARVRDLEKRLAEAVQREAEASKRAAEAVGQLQTRDRELAEAQEQQTATSEILRVISSSPTDYQPVFDTIVSRAGVVCGAVDAVLWTVDGDELVVRAHHGPIPATIGARQPTQGSVAGGAVREARIVHVEDLTQADDFPVGRDIARRLGWRSTLSAPLLREGVAIGAILVRRSEVRPFTDKQIALLQTFADEAVIAIENVRLFRELQEKNRALEAAHAQVTEALEQQTATSEILRVISTSPTDARPVFDTIIRNAVRLLGGFSGVVTRHVDGQLHLAALTSTNPLGDAAQKALWPKPVAADKFHGRVITSLEPVVITDVESDRSGPSGGGCRRPRARLSKHHRRPSRSRGTCGWINGRDPSHGRPIFRQRDRATQDLRRPSRHRHRERAIVHRASSEQS
jgi:putative methionine-R-sulfoxide reductase with GAF domain